MGCLLLSLLLLSLSLGFVVVVEGILSFALLFHGTVGCFKVEARGFASAWLAVRTDTRRGAHPQGVTYARYICCVLPPLFWREEDHDDDDV